MAPRIRTARVTPELPRIDALGSATRYEMVKRHLLEMINKGHWPTGTVLPSEVTLSRLFGVAVGTVRRALSDLTAEGLVFRRRKTGTVVTGRVPQHNLRHFFQYFRLHGRGGRIVHSRAVLLGLAGDTATAGEAAALQITEGDGVIHVHRVRNVDGKPVMHERMVLPAARLPDFPTAAEIPELLYRFVLDRYGIRISAIREEVSAELATPEDRALLQLDDPAAVLRIDEVAFDQGGAPIILADHRATTAGYIYINELR